MNPEVEADVEMMEGFARKGQNYLHLICPDEILNACRALRALDRENAELRKDKERYLATLRFARLVLEECAASPTVQLAIKAIDAAMAMKGGGD